MIRHVPTSPSLLHWSSVLQFLFLKHIRFSPTWGVVYFVSSCWEYSPWVFTSLATFHPSGLRSNVASSSDSPITLSKVAPTPLLHHPIYFLRCTCSFFFFNLFTIYFPSLRYKALVYGLWSFVQSLLASRMVLGTE